MLATNIIDIEFCTFRWHPIACLTAPYDCKQPARSKNRKNNSHRHCLNFFNKVSDIGIWGINYFLRWTKNKGRNERIPLFDTSWSLAMHIFEGIGGRIKDNTAFLCIPWPSHFSKPSKYYRLSTPNLKIWNPKCP